MGVEVTDETQVRIVLATLRLVARSALESRDVGVLDPAGAALVARLACELASTMKDYAPREARR